MAPPTFLSMSSDMGVFRNPLRRLFVTGISLACQLSFTLAELSGLSFGVKISQGHLGSAMASLLPHSGVLLVGSQFSVSQPIFSCVGRTGWRVTPGLCSLAL